MGNSQSTNRGGGSGEGNERSDRNRQPEAVDTDMQIDRNDVPTSSHRSPEAPPQRSSLHYSNIYGSLRRLGGRNNQENNGRTTYMANGAEDNANLLDATNGDMQQEADATIHHPRSRLSRVGSRLLPEQVLRGLLSSGEETAEEGQALRQGSQLRRRLSVFDRHVSLTGNDRSISSDASRRRIMRNDSALGQRPRPFSTNLSETLMERDLNHSLQSLGNNTASSRRENDAHYVEPLPRGRRTRFTRARHSIHLPLTSLFGASRNRGSMYVPRSPTPHPGQNSDQSDSASFSDSNHSTRHDRDHLAHELDAVEPETRHLLSASRITSGMSSIRRFPHGLRSRSTRLIRRGEHPPLSQVLQLAAAAIAAQLSGHGNENGVDGTRSLGGEAFDGSIQNFVQTLQEAASAQAGEDIDLNATDGDLPPVNFMRVFQFPNDENGVPIGPPHNRRATRVGPDGNATNDSDRSVTLVLVGVRSMPNVTDGPSQGGGNPGPSLDALLSLPFMPPANILRNGSSGALFRRSDTRTRSGQRQSPPTFNFPAQYETQRHSASRSGSSGNVNEQPLLGGGTITPTPISESPLGPHPPPSTPADPRSGHVTPNQRPASASTASASQLPHQEENQSRLNEPALNISSTAGSTPTTSRQRRRSDTGFARRPDLGSGAARRNGVVEPDRPPGGAGRSWLIYVVGTNVSPDHPAFTMPSLFTENPSYEDMQMLSTLLGPVKPPVATQDDVNSAGGTYRLIAQDNMLIAVPFANEALDSIGMVNGDRCLICLCDYEAEEQVRQLNSCSHIFHRDCIDEWLTTGRNSCPMCRGQGVKEQGPSGEASAAQEQEI